MRTDVKIETEFNCPYCDARYTIGEDAIYEDHVEDEIAEQCQACGNWYQLWCEHVEVTMECRKAPKQQEDQSD